jgi:hypothetical protein
MNKCPHCGKLLPPGKGWERREISIFGAGHVAVDPGVEYERRTPARDASIESDVAVPAAQSVITALLLGSGGGAFAAVAGAPRSLLIGVGVGATAATISWLSLLSDHRRLLWTFETVTGQDVDGDGSIGQPDQHQEPVTVEIVKRERKNHTSMHYVNLGLSEGELKRVANALLVRREPLSRRGLEDVLESERYSKFLDALLKANLAYPKGKSLNAGVELSGPGRFFFRQYLEN